MTLNDAILGNEYVINNVETQDEEITSFLFTLGCYEGEPITVVNKKRNNLTISVKDARYNIDFDLASAISI